MPINNTNEWVANRGNVYVVVAAAAVVVVVVVVKPQWTVLKVTNEQLVEA